MNTYSFSELVKKVWKSLVVIIIFALIGGIGMGILAKKHQTTTYTAETSVIISHNLEENRHIKDAQDSMVNADMNMMPTYESIAKNTATADEAHKLLPKKIKKNYSVSDVDNAITAQTKPQSLVMNIRAESKSSKDSPPPFRSPPRWTSGTSPTSRRACTWTSTSGATPTAASWRR